MSCLEIIVHKMSLKSLESNKMEARSTKPKLWLRYHPQVELESRANTCLDRIEYFQDDYQCHEPLEILKLSYPAMEGIQTWLSLFLILKLSKFKKHMILSCQVVMESLINFQTENVLIVLGILLTMIKLLMFISNVERFLISFSKLQLQNELQTTLLLQSLHLLTSSILHLIKQITILDSNTMIQSKA